MSEQARIGTRMKTLREEKRMSEADLSVALGVSRMTINNYEQGKRIPDVDFTLLLLASDSKTPKPIIGMANKAIVELNHFVEGYDELQKSMVRPVSELKRRLVPESQIRLALRDKEKAIGYYGLRANQHIGETITSCAEDMEKELLRWADEAMSE